MGREVSFGGGWKGRIEKEVGRQMETYNFINVIHINTYLYIYIYMYTYVHI